MDITENEELQVELQDSFMGTLKAGVQVTYKKAENYEYVDPTQQKMLEKIKKIQAMQRMGLEDRKSVELTRQTTIAKGYDGLRESQLKQEKSRQLSRSSTFVRQQTDSSNLFLRQQSSILSQATFKKNMTGKFNFANDYKNDTFRQTTGTQQLQKMQSEVHQATSPTVPYPFQQTLQKTASIIVEKVAKQDSSDPNEDIVLDGTTETDRFQRFDTFNMMDFLKDGQIGEPQVAQIPKLQHKISTKDDMIKEKIEEDAAINFLKTLPRKSTTMRRQTSLMQKKDGLRLGKQISSLNQRDTDFEIREVDFSKKRKMTKKAHQLEPVQDEFDHPIIDEVIDLTKSDRMDDLKKIKQLEEEREKLKQIVKIMKQEQQLTEQSHHKHSRHKHSHQDSHMEQETAHSLPDGINQSEFNMNLNNFCMSVLNRPISAVVTESLDLKSEGGIKEQVKRYRKINEVLNMKSEQNSQYIKVDQDLLRDDSDIHLKDFQKKINERKQRPKTTQGVRKRNLQRVQQSHQIIQPQQIMASSDADGLTSQNILSNTGTRPVSGVLRPSDLASQQAPMVFMDDISSIQNTQHGSRVNLLSGLDGPGSDYDTRVSNKQLSSVGICFSRKEIQTMKDAAKPPIAVRPSKQKKIASLKDKGNKLQNSYAPLINMGGQLKNTTYVNYPNKSKAIMKMKGQNKCKTFLKANNPIMTQPMSGLEGQLKIEMENFRPTNSTKAIKKYNEQFNTKRSQSVTHQKRMKQIQQRPSAVDTSQVNVIRDPKTAPLTGTSHILLQYQPYMEYYNDVDFIHMGGNVYLTKNKKDPAQVDKNIKYYQGDKLMELNPEHFYPSFVAKDVNDLRKINGLRQTMEKFRIQPPAEDDEQDASDKKPKQGQSSRNISQNIKSEALRVIQPLVDGEPLKMPSEPQDQIPTKPTIKTDQLDDAPTLDFQHSPSQGIIDPTKSFLRQPSRNLDSANIQIAQSLNEQQSVAVSQDQSPRDIKGSSKNLLLTQEDSLQSALNDLHMLQQLKFRQKQRQEVKIISHKQVVSPVASPANKDQFLAPPNPYGGNTRNGSNNKKGSPNLKDTPKGARQSEFSFAGGPAQVTYFFQLQ